MSKKQVVGVYCTESDLQDPTVIKIAKALKIVPEDFGADAEGLYSFEEDQLQKILYFLFGFKGGWYEKELVETQRTRIGNKLVKDSYRYVGVERQDKEWVESSMCSEQTKEIVKWGTVL